jgi:hypothetical protein
LNKLFVYLTAKIRFSKNWPEKNEEQSSSDHFALLSLTQNFLNLSLKFKKAKSCEAK